MPYSSWSNEWRLHSCTSEGSTYLLRMHRSRMISKRRLTQVITALLYNCNFTGFAKGTIYQGNSKALCVPGLNCYSCPGAAGSCPLGSLQSALSSGKGNIPYYILGVLLLMGALLGRFICGFLCPFGFLQELLHKIPTMKIKKSNLTRKLSYIKYVILIVFVIGIPLILHYPGFCKYICPAGTLEGGIPLAIANPGIRSMLGFLFSWKIALLAIILVSAVFMYRSFCRFLCPLGAFYSLFNRVSLVRIEVDKSTCTNCNTCKSFCKMDIEEAGDRECIQCGECISLCPHNSICRKFK